MAHDLRAVPGDALEGETTTQPTPASIEELTRLFDEKVAESAGYPSLIAPPTFPSALQDFEALLERLEINPHAIMHAEEEYEYFKPIFAGDTVVVTHTVVDAYEKDAPRGRLVFVVVETRGNDKRSKAIFKGRRVLVEVRK